MKAPDAHSSVGNMTEQLQAQAIRDIESRHDEQCARVREAQAAHLADPKNEGLRQRIDHAIAELEKIEFERAELLRPRMSVGSMRFSEEESRTLAAAERVRFKYNGRIG